MKRQDSEIQGLIRDKRDLESEICRSSQRRQRSSIDSNRGLNLSTLEQDQILREKEHYILQLENSLAEYRTEMEKVKDKCIELEL